MYIPIILAAFFFAMKGAVAAALLGGLALGPLMPVNVQEGVMQEPNGWILRIILFTGIGLFFAFLMKRVRDFKKAEIENSFLNVITGIPNANKLRLDLNEMINQDVSFSAIGFRIINIDDINRYLGYDMAYTRSTDALTYSKNIFRALFIQSIRMNLSQLCQRHHPGRLRRRNKIPGYNEGYVFDRPVPD
jgi:hypothetical protein